MEIIRAFLPMIGCILWYAFWVMFSIQTGNFFGLGLPMTWGFILTISLVDNDWTKCFRSKTAYTLALVFSLMLTSLGGFVYINGSMRHYLAYHFTGEPQPVKILVTHKGDFVKTLRCTKPTLMVPFYHQIKEVPLDPKSGEYYDFVLIYGEKPFGRHGNFGDYITGDGEKVRYKVNIGYIINIYNAAAIYRKYHTVDPQEINQQIFQSISDSIAMVTKENSIWILTKGLAYFEIQRIIEERMIYDQSLWYMPGDASYGTAHGSLMSINVHTASRQELNEAYQEEIRRLQLDDLPPCQPEINSFQD